MSRIWLKMVALMQEWFPTPDRPRHILRVTGFSGRVDDRPTGGGAGALWRWFAVWPLIATALAGSQQTSAGDSPSFLNDVAPIFLKRCTGCHGRVKSEGGYRLHTFEYLTMPGASELESIVAGSPQESELFIRIMESDESMRMPQEDDPLSAKETELIGRWIESGAAYDGSSPSATIRSEMPPRLHPASPSRYAVAVPVYAVAFSPDGSTLAVSGYREITFWNPESGELMGRIGGLPQRIHSLAWHPDGMRLFAGGGIPGEYGELSEVNIGKGIRSRVFGVWGDVVLSTALSHDGTRLLGTSADTVVRCYSVDSGDRQWQSELHADWVTSGAFTADDQFVATGGCDFAIKVLDADSGKLYATYKGHQRNLGAETGRFAVHCITFDDNGPLAFSAGGGQSIRVWEPEKAKAEDGDAGDMEIRFFRKGHTRFIKHNSNRPVFGLVTWTNHLFAATGDGAVKEYAIDTLEEVRTYMGHSGWVFCLDAHVGIQRVAAGAFSGEVHIWSTVSGKLATSFVAAPGIGDVTVSRVTSARE